MNRKLATLVLVASVCLVTASSVGATGAGQLCRSFKQGALTYTSQTIGTKWTCGSAKTWILKLSADRVGHVTRNVTLKNGPRGYHCFANPVSRGGRATAGDCFTGTIAFPKSGFAWTGSPR